jgi:hypothetical protein
MRHIRLPLPTQHSHAHQTARDRAHAARPRSQDLLMEWIEGQEFSEDPAMHSEQASIRDASASARHTDRLLTGHR